MSPWLARTHTRIPPAAQRGCLVLLGSGSVLRAPWPCSKVSSYRDGRGGDRAPPALLSPKALWPPPGNMPSFILNCLLSFDALESIWFKGERLPDCNLWLPGGAYS